MNRPVTAQAPIYGEAIAQIHARAFAGTFHAGFDWLASQVAGSALQPLLFDIGCGNGDWLAHAAARGIACRGIDQSPAFVKMCRQRGLDAHPGQAARAPLPRGTTAITALGEVLAYQPAALAPVVLNAARALPEGGLLLFDLPGPEVPAGDHDKGGPGWRLTSQVRLRGAMLTRKIHLETTEGTSQEVHHQRLFSPGEARDIVQGLGFEVEILDSYGPAPMLPGRFAIRARKPCR